MVRTLFLRATTIITDDRPWMFSIPPKTANTSSTKSEVVSIRAHSFSLPYTCKGFQKTGSRKFSKNKELAHSTSLSRPSGSTWPTPKIRHTTKENEGWCTKFSVRASDHFLARPFGVRFKEHVAITKASTRAVGDHLKRSGHISNMSSSSILVRKEDMFKRRVREVIKIFCRVPTLKRDAGYEIPRSIGTF